MSIDEAELRFRRHIDGRICLICDGWGVHAYSNTSTWRRGVGGAMITYDVCDACWGSGDADNLGVDLREQMRSESYRIAKAAMDHLCHKALVEFKHCRPAVVAIAEELERLSRGRKQRPEWFDMLCVSIATTLRQGVADREEFDRLAAEAARR